MVFSARRLLLAVLLVVAAVIWVKINHPVEGRTLFELSRNHGVTTADLLSLVALAMAVVLAWPGRRPPRPAPFVTPAAGSPGPGTTAPIVSRPGAPGPPPGTRAGPAPR